MIVGVLADVSGSMKEVLQKSITTPENETISRAHCIIRTLINISKDESAFKSDLKIFAIVFGLLLQNYEPDSKNKRENCDLLSLMEYFKNRKSKTTNEFKFLKQKLELLQNEILTGSSANNIRQNCNNFIRSGGGLICDNFHIEGHEPLLWLLNIHGAPYAECYIRRQTDRVKAGTLFEIFCEDRELSEKVVKILPYQCKYKVLNDSAERGTSMLTSKSTLIGQFVNYFVQYEERESNAVEKYEMDALNVFGKKLVDKATPPKLWTMEQLSTQIKVLFQTYDNADHNVREIECSRHKIDSLLKWLEPFIYGDTPMRKALEDAISLYPQENFNQKALLIISDGDSRDGDPEPLSKILKDDYKVTIFCCFLTSENILTPRKLYDSLEGTNWTKHEKTMFEMSSKVPTTSSGMCLLLRQGWQLPESGEAKLFIQANHPEVIDEFSKLVLKIFDSTDVLLDIIGTVHLDWYINQTNQNCQPPDQDEETCYANAVATVFHLAMHRIVGREGGYPDFMDIREKLIKKYGVKSANTKRVLLEQCPSYRLYFNKGYKDNLVTERDARLALTQKRPLVARFRLTATQWKNFKNFFSKNGNPQGILTKSAIGAKILNEKTSGHAVVLIRCDANCLTFMNSWGTDWGNSGFFSIKDSDVLNGVEYFDVDWKNNLTTKEKEALANYKRDLLARNGKIVSNIPLDLHRVPFICPICNKESNVFEFSGHINEAKCPKCNNNFKPTLSQLMQSLYICPR